MNRASVLLQLVRASFLERVRRRNFQVILLGVTMMSLAIAAGRLVLRLDVYLGEYNSAWVGALVAGSTTVLLCFANFFIIKNGVGLDRDTGVGELIAATPMSKFVYLTGKALSNFAVLVSIEIVLFAAAIVIQLVHGEMQVEWLSLLLPFVFIALPAMAVISTLALFFEVLPGLRSGFGNLLFVFLWFTILFLLMTYGDIWLDLPGILYINAVFTAAARSMALPFEGGFSIEGGTLAGPYAQLVRWENVNWLNELVGWRLYWFAVAIGLAVLAAIFFDRFDSSRGSFYPFRRKHPKISQARLHKTEIKDDDIGEKKGPMSQESLGLQLHSAVKTSGLGCFGRMLRSELLLISKQPWWWYLILLAMFVTSFIVPAADARTVWVPLIWLWLALAISGIGVRDSQYHTDQLVFSAPHPLQHQFFATWMAGIILTILVGFAGLRVIWAGEGAAALPWGIGALFIPTFALAAGVLSGNQRLFEGVYCAWWLIGPMASKGNALDFMGVHSEVVARGIHWYYLALTILLLALAYIGRWRQVRCR